MRRVILVAFSIACTPLPGVAQTTGTLVMRAEPTPTVLQPVNSRTAKIVYGWARCTTRRHRDDARDLLQLDYRTPEYGAALRALAGKSGRCLFPGESLRLNGSVLFAGGLAENLFRQEFARGNMVELATKVQTSPPISARDEIEMAALCVARREPRDVGALLATQPGSEVELSRMGALKPVLVGCVPAGSQVRFSRWTLRPLLALAVYRLARHATRSADVSWTRARSDA